MAASRGSSKAEKAADEVMGVCTLYSLNRGISRQMYQMRQMLTDYRRRTIAALRPSEALRESTYPNLIFLVVL